MQQLVALARWIKQNFGIGRIQTQVGDHGEKLIFIPLNNHKFAGLDVFHAAVGVELHLNALGQRPLRDNTDFAAILNIGRTV